MGQLKRFFTNEYVRHGVIGLLIVIACASFGVVYPASVVARTAALVLALLFAYRYSRRPWRSTREGRHLMSFTLIVAGFMFYATLNHVVAVLDTVPAMPDGHYPGREVAGLVLYMLVAWELYQRNRLLSSAYPRSSGKGWTVAPRA